jgi:curli production assembly/transport component CsgG
MRYIILMLAAAMLSSCSSGSISNSVFTSDARVADKTKTGEMLHNLPAAAQKVVVSVYNFEDQTGQHKPDDASAQYSRAVTQGGLAILNKALLDAGRSGWFTVIERGGLQNLLQERQLVRATRDQYRLPNGQKLPDLGPLLYAGLLFEGGIVSYESNVLTGGVGARYLGIGGSTEYRQDIVTVYLRAVSVQTGEVLLAVNTSKTIYSSGLQGGTYKYVALDKLLEIESGFTVNEPPQFAVRQAIEMAVYSIIMEGADKGIWNFADTANGKELLDQYIYLRDGTKPVVTTAIAPANNPVVETVTQTPTEPAREPVVIPVQPQTNSSINVPTGTLRKQAQNGTTQDPAMTSPSVNIESEQYINNPKRDKLYCTSGGCYPFPPPTR